MSENSKTMTLKEFAKYAVIRSTSPEEQVPSLWNTVLVCPDLDMAKTCVELLSGKAENGAKYMYMPCRAGEFLDGGPGPAEMLRSEFPLDGRNNSARIQSRGLRVSRRAENMFCEILSLLNAAHEDGIALGRTFGRADALTDMMSTIGDEIDSLSVDLDTERAKFDDDNYSWTAADPEGGKA